MKIFHPAVVYVVVVCLALNINGYYYKYKQCYYSLHSYDELQNRGLPATRRKGCSRWNWSLCLPDEYECGPGLQTGRRSGPRCATRQRVRRCMIPCATEKPRAVATTTSWLRDEKTDQDIGQQQISKEFPGKEDNKTTTMVIQLQMTTRGDEKPTPDSNDIPKSIENGPVGISECRYWTTVCRGKQLEMKIKLNEGFHQACAQKLNAPCVGLPDNDDEQHVPPLNLKYSTMNAYESAFNISQYKQSRRTKLLYPRRCKPIQFHLIARHGTRWPSRFLNKAANTLHSQIKATSDPGTQRFQIARLLKWKNRFPNDLNTGQLSPKGMVQMAALGRRFGYRLEELLQNVTAMDEIKTIATHKRRTIISAVEFLHGFLNGERKNIHHNEIDVNSSLLRPYDHCPKYLQQLNRKSTVREFLLFRVGPNLKNITLEVNQRIQRFSPITIDHGDLRTIYRLCAYELANFASSPWCSLLKDKDTEALEYLSDLEYYWTQGYGQILNKRISCPLLDYTTAQIRDAVETSLYQKESKHPKILLNFGHTATMIPILTSLGLFEENTPLKSTNMRRMRDRSFKTSRLIPFGANLALVLYDCSHAFKQGRGRKKRTKKISDFRVEILLNEQPIIFPFCKKRLCPWRIVEKGMLEHCDKPINCNRI